MAEGITSATTAKGIVRRLLRQEETVLFFVLLSLIAIFGVVTSGKTIARVNMSNIVVQSSMRGVAAIGEAFVLLSAGIDLSVGGVALFVSILGTSAMSSGSENVLGHPITVPAGILVMLLAGAGWGAINGSLVSRAGIPALIVTLGMWEVTKGAAFRLTGGSFVTGLPVTLSYVGAGKIAGVPVPTAIFVAVTVIGYLVLNYTIFGRSVYAVGGSPVSARLSGVNIRYIQLWVYLIAGLLAALAAVINAGRIMSASMQTLTGLELDAIAAVVIGGVSLAGGRGSLIGVLIGVLMIGVINNGMSVLGSGPDIQGVVKGAIIVTAVGIDYWRRRH